MDPDRQREIQQLRHLLAQKEREKQQIMEALTKAQEASSQNHSRPMKRSKTAHAPGGSTTAPMVRATSSIAATGAGSNVFRTLSSSVAPPPVAGWRGPSDSFNQAQLLTADSPFAPAPPQFGSLGLEMNVEEFLSMRGQELMPDGSDAFTTSPVGIPPPLLSPAQESDQFHGSSVASLCGSLTSGPTLETAPMSRCNSNLNDNASISGRFSEMVRIQSEPSSQGHFGGNNVHPGSFLGKRLLPESDCLLTIPTDAYPSPSSYPSSAPTDSIPLPHHHAMERSVSKESVRSNSSLQHRAKEALTRQNGNAARRLQPKPAAPDPKNGAAAAADPANNGGAQAKAVITKTKYERPKHPKVLCNQCNDHPEGFRGEHELRRHTEAKHKSMVKKWICRDPAQFGVPHSVEAVKPLKDCKQCSANKQYGAYYNAAAHLRRTHFRVKPKKGAGAGGGGSRNGSDGKADEREKRGGKGGGDFPPMSELKLWMYEVMVPLDKAGSLAADENESVGAAEADDQDGELPDAGTRYGTQQSSGFGAGGLAVGSDAFDMTTFAGVGSGFGQDMDLAGRPFAAVPDEFSISSQLSALYHPPGLLLPDEPLLGGLPTSSTQWFDAAKSLDASASQPATFSTAFSAEAARSSASSAATVTQAPLAYSNPVHRGVAGMQGGQDDLAEFSFDLTFTSPEQ
ncbi:hypothetical protein VTK26DRAFT_7634 [Humicola hyalothermophila]